MWLTAAAFVVVIVIAGMYEVWALAFAARYSITALTRRAPHKMLILVAAFFTMLGYALGVGGQ